MAKWAKWAGSMQKRYTPSVHHLFSPQLELFHLVSWVGLLYTLVPAYNTFSTPFHHRRDLENILKLLTKISLSVTIKNLDDINCNYIADFQERQWEKDN